MSLIDQPRMIRALRRYFASGWAFLIPYQLAYLLYYWRQWPSNPGTETAAKTAIPSLLVVYWAMHTLHIALALLASASPKMEEGKAHGGDDQGRALHRHQLRAMSSELLATIARRLLSLFTSHSSIFRRPFTHHSSLFWISLALLFYIPGVYLEFPSDPWEHLRRINEWKAHEVVHWHAAGYKSLYFFAYSLVGWIRASSQMPALNLYYTGMCLLLSWQYYLLARVAGLPKRWAQGFVLLHLLIAGNVSFSFFRYYGIASTAFSQLGAIVLIRLAMTWAKNHRRSVEPQRHKEPTGLKISLWPQCLRGSISDRIRAIRGFISRLFLPFTLHFSLFVSALGAALLVVNNHVQGLGIAALGCASVLAWRLVGWPRRPWMGWLMLISVLVVGSFATYHLWPRSPQFAALIPQGWITTWYGFSLLAPASPAFDRMIQILGGFGLLNFAAGIYLIARRQLAGWLTLFPIVILALPLGAIPVADSIVRSNVIITYHRMFFAIPAGLALVALLRELTLRRQAQPRCEVLTTRPLRLTLQPSPFSLHRPFTRHSISAPFALALTGLLVISVVPASKPWFNRTWQVLAQVPEDLSMRPAWLDLAHMQQRPNGQAYEQAHGAQNTATTRSTKQTPQDASDSTTSHPAHALATTTALSFVLNLQDPTRRIALGALLAPDNKAWIITRHYVNSARSPADDFDAVRNAMAKLVPLEFLTSSPTAFYTPYSQAALTSGHWIPQEVLLATTGMPEIEAIAQAKSLEPHPLPGKTTLWKPAE